MESPFVLAVALILVIEGGLYALFPERMRGMAEQVSRLPPETLRHAGLFAAIIGVGIIWIVRA